MEDLLAQYQKHFSLLCGAACSLFDIKRKQFQDGQNWFCQHCKEPCDFVNTHLYGCYESARWDNRYIYYCKRGLIFVAAPVFNEMNLMDFGMICGPVQMGNPEDLELVTGVPVMSTAKVNSLAEILSAVFSEKTANSNTDEAFLNDLYKQLDALPENHQYPMKLEQQLRQAISNGDRQHAGGVLNQLLGQIFFYSNADFKRIRTRVLELVVLLSRAAIEGGADSAHILSLNNRYIEEAEGFVTIEQLSRWLSNVIEQFMSQIFDLGRVKHTDIIYKIIAYVNENYMKRILLDDIAEHVYLSKSYVSKIFKEEMDIGVSAYITKVRVEKSMELMRDKDLSLVEVANLAGFEDQSYFTKLFKQLVGVSPGKYREKLR